MSSLAQQLQGIASIDASRLTSRTGAPSSKSYLFDLTEAAQQDLDAVWAIAQEGYEQLCSLDSEMLEFEEEIFAERTKRVDRMMLTKEENRVLDVVLERCLRRLGRWIGVMAGGKCLEWLVRRFRVHEMNVGTVIQVFLPYHDSQNFPRMLSILTIPPTSIYYAPFSPLIRRAQPVARSYIATAISPAKEPSLRLLRSVVGMVDAALREAVVHRALLAFWTSTIVELLENMRSGKGIQEGVVVALVEAFVEVLSTPGAGQDVNAAVYPPLILLTRSVRLADGPFLAILSALITPATGAVPTQRVLTLLVLLNDRKGWNQGLGVDGAQNLAKIKMLGETLEVAMGKYGFEEALRVVLGILLDRSDLNAKTLRRLLDNPSLAASLVKLAATKLVSSKSDQTRGTNDSLLSSLRERHPAIVDAAIVEAGSDIQLNSDLLDRVSTGKAFVDVYAADVATRVKSIAAVFDALNGDVESDKASAREAIRLRLGDDDLPVIQAVYARAEELKRAFSIDEIVRAIRPAFVSDRPKRIIITAHLDFVGKSSDAEGEQVMEQLLFPVLLASRGRVLLGKEQWQEIAPGTLGRHSIISAVAAAVNKVFDEKDEASEVDANRAIIRSLAAAIGSSPHFERLSSYLISSAANAHTPSRLLAQLVLAQLLKTLDAKRAGVIAFRTLETIQPLLRGLNLRDVAESAEATSKTINKAFFTHLEDGSTASRIMVSLLSALGEVRRPTHSIDWLNESSTSTAYRSFTKALYALTNSALLHQVVARDLLRSILTQLGQDALLFFASIWTDTASFASPFVRTAALKHAAAFIRAHGSGDGAEAKKVDFQILIPTVLVALRDGDKVVREASVEVLRAVAEFKQVGEVYALESIYGDRSGTVQLLKPTYLERYLTSLLSASDDLILDPKRLIAVHSSTLGHAKSSDKKETGIKRAIISSIASHITAWQSFAPRLLLLDTLQGLHDPAIIKVVLPIWSGLIDDDSNATVWLAAQSEKEQERFLVQLGKTFNKGSGTALLNAEGDSWRFFLGLLASGPATRFGSRIRLMAQERMATGILDVLPPTQQIPYISALIQSLHDLPSEEALASTAVLKKCRLSPAAVVQLLSDLSAPLESVPGKKRQKHEEGGGEADKADLAVLDLTVLLESRDWTAGPGHAGLVAALLAVLSSVLAKKQVIKEGADYLEQEVLGAILAQLELIKDASEVQTAHIGIEPIIKTIRSTSNPRTSQRALLVAAELARLNPDAVLHNVMPIFTFMGSTELQRDDAYTFGVVEKTVKRIVPVLVASLRQTAAGAGLELWSTAASFISIFTDMAGRLPKHRTLPFFVHLVQSLGAEDFLAPVGWLLIDRSVVKGKNGGSGSGNSQAVELALGVADAASRQARLITLRETVQESSRLLADLSNAEKTAFLSRFLDESDESSRTTRQVISLLHFASGLASSLTGKPLAQDVIQGVVQDLVGMMASAKSPGMDDLEIPLALRRCLSEVMKLLGAEQFLSVVVQILSTGDSTLKKQNVVIALDLFTERLPLVKKEIRAKAASSISTIVRKAAELLVPASSTAALAAMRAVVSTALPSEDSALAAVAPKVVSNIKTQSETAVINEEISLLDIMTRRLGPRIIPAIQPMLTTLLAIIDGTSTSSSTLKASFGTLSAMIETVPTFISATQLGSILKTTVQARVRSEESSSAMISTCAKRISTKTLFPVVMDLWKDAQGLDELSMEGYFHLLRLALKNAERSTLPGLVKTIFNFFLDVFDLRHKLHSNEKFDLQVINSIEESAIGSFLELVTKLNESTFKPLFTRLYDWAIIDLSGGNDEKRLNERKTVLLHVMMGLLTKFRSLLSPYIGTLLPHIEELLPAYSEGTTTDPELWTLLVRVLGKSFEVDDGAFWTEALYLKLIPRLAAQISVFPELTRSSTTSALAYCLSAMAASTTSEPSLKALNTRICLATREEDVAVRLAALRVLEAVWEKQAEEMVALVPETVSEYLAELLEDENGDVENLARGVLGKIEKVTGSLKEYLE